MNQNELSIWQRLTAPAPKLFAFISKIALVMGALAFSLANFNGELAALGLVVPTVLVKAATIAQWIAAGALAVSKLTVDFEKYKKQNAI